MVKTRKNKTKEEKRGFWNMPKGKYKNRFSSYKRADLIGFVRIRANTLMKQGLTRTKAFKKAWKQIKKEELE
jgi:hypothetical protein